MKPFHVYILRLRDGRYYAGHTDDLDKRFREHMEGTHGGYTAARRPVTLVWSAEVTTRDEALAAELTIKGWSRAKKEALIRDDWEAISELGRNRTGPDLRRGTKGSRRGVRSTARASSFDKLRRLSTSGHHGTVRPEPKGPFALSLSKGERERSDGLGTSGCPTPSRGRVT